MDRRELPKPITVETQKEVERLRAVAEEKKDEESRKNLHDYMVNFRLGQ